ncbi:MAG: hypothetical protein KGL59_10225 [Acidobacteriota bacterium]|nr:hypothetical protein [Acidobacteriota bacterium]
MKPTELGKGLSFKDAIGIFWEWRQASISVEVCFFGKAKASETVRVSIDGLVSLVDPEGIITVSGDGREIELDLRGCQFHHAKDVPGRAEIFDPLDPDSILQVKFPNGEICLVFPYRRVAPSPITYRRASSGLEWLRTKIGRSSTFSLRQKTDSAGRKLHAVSSRNGGSKPGTSRSGPPIFPIAAFVAIFMLVAIALTPANLPRLFSELGLSPRPVSEPNAMVWAIQHEGNYYCAGSVLAGRKPGEFMKQSDALTLGYQPALGHYCGAAVVNGASPTENVSFYLEQLTQSSTRVLYRLFYFSRSLLT